MGDGFVHHFHGTGVSVENTAHFLSATGPERVEAVAMRFAVVDDEGLGEFLGEGDVFRQKDFLLLRRCGVPMIVEAGLADGDDARMLCQHAQTLPFFFVVLACVLWMQRHGGVRPAAPFPRGLTAASASSKLQPMFTTAWSVRVRANTSS